MRVCGYGQEGEDPAGAWGSAEALIANGNTPQKHVRRAQIVLLAGDGVGTDEIQRRLAVSRPTIRHWRSRIAQYPRLANRIENSASSTITRKIDSTTDLVVRRPTLSALPTTFSPS